MSGRQNKPAKATAKPLTARQELFVDYYFRECFNATAAARAAGYKTTNASKTGWRLLNESQYKHVRQAIEKRKQALLESAGKEFRAKILENWMVASDLDPLDLYHSDGSPRALDQIEPHIRKCITGVSEFIDGEGTSHKVYKLVNKTKTQELAAKALGMFQERIQVEQHVEIAGAFADVTESLARLVMEEEAGSR